MPLVQGHSAAELGVGNVEVALRLLHYRVKAAWRKAATTSMLPCKITQKQPKITLRDNTISKTTLTAAKPGWRWRYSTSPAPKTHK